MKTQEMVHRTGFVLPDPIFQPADGLADHHLTTQVPRMHEAPITVQGKVLKILKAELYQVRLPNGKVTLGHLSKDLKKISATLQVGQTVKMEMTPFDFDSGRIAELAERNPLENEHQNPTPLPPTFESPE